MCLNGRTIEWSLSRRVLARGAGVLSVLGGMMLGAGCATQQARGVSPQNRE